MTYGTAFSLCLLAFTCGLLLGSVLTTSDSRDGTSVPRGERRDMAERRYVGDGVHVEFDSGFSGNTVLVTNDGFRDTNRIELEPEVWEALLMLRRAHDLRKAAR